MDLGEMEEDDPTKYCCLLTSTPQRAPSTPLTQPQVNYGFNAVNPLSPPLFSHSSVDGSYQQAQFSHQEKQFETKDCMEYHDNALAADCSKSPWLSYSSATALTSNSVIAHNVPQKCQAARPLQEIMGNHSNFQHMPNPMVSPIPLLNCRSSSGVKALIKVDSLYRRNEYADIQSANSISPCSRTHEQTWGNEAGIGAYNYNTPNARRHLTLFDDKSYPQSNRDVDNIKNTSLKCISSAPAFPNVTTSFATCRLSQNEVSQNSISCQLSNPFQSYVPLLPSRNGVVYFGGSYVSERFGNHEGLSRPYHEAEKLPTASQISSQGPLRGLSFQGQSIRSNVESGALLTASMCMPKSSQASAVGFPSQSFLHSSPFVKKVTLKSEIASESERKVLFPPKISDVDATKSEVDAASSNAKERCEWNNTPARIKYPSGASNESADSGFDSIHRSPYNYSNECSSLDDYSLEQQQQQQPDNVTPNEEAAPFVGSTPTEVVGSTTACLPKVQRKLDTPQRSASPLDPLFRGVTLQMRTKMQEDDKVQLSIKAFFNCQKSSRPHNKASDNDVRPRTRSNSTSSSDSDFAAELFPKKRRAHNTGKQCASCRTKTTPLWRDAEDGTPLCNACGIRYRKYRVRCMSCWHIPRKETKANLQCTNCGATLKLSLMRTKQWKY